MHVDERSDVSSNGDGVLAGTRLGAIDGSERWRRGSGRVSGDQRERMFAAALELVSEQGYAGMSVSRITGRACVSRTKFYDYFESREDCFLAAVDDALEQLGEVVVAGYDGPARWSERMRAALEALLGLLEDKPVLGSVFFVQTAGSTQVSLAERRAKALDAVRAVVEDGLLQARAGHQPPPLAAEVVVGGVITVIRARLAQHRPRQLIALVGPLMAMIVLPYLGAAAAKRELKRPVPKRPPPPEPVEAAQHTPKGRTVILNMRATYRTLMVLRAIRDQPGACSREIADAAGISDDGQISKLLQRLERHELVRSSATRVGQRHVWHLTPRGRDVAQAMSVELRLSER